jgi:hypothetical protein
MDKIEILKLPVPKLRELASKIEGIQGVTGMNKEQLHKALFEHHGIPLEDVTHIVKDPAAKKKIRELKNSKAEALKAGDKKKSMILKKRLHDAKRVTRAWTKAKVRAKALTKKGSA